MQVFSNWANDTLLFCKDDDNMLNSLRRIIELFEWCPSQKVDWENLGCLEWILKIGCWPQLLNWISRQNLYRLCILDSRRISKKDVILAANYWKKIQKKLDRWKIFNLSQGGRLTLNKTVLSNLPIYYVLFCYAYEGNWGNWEDYEEFLLGRSKWQQNQLVG